MDKFTDMMLVRTGQLSMVGKALGGIIVINSIKKHRSVSLIAVRGLAYLVSKAFKEHHASSPLKKWEWRPFVSLPLKICPPLSPLIVMVSPFIAYAPKNGAENSGYSF